MILAAVPEVEVLDLAGPLQVFHEARRRGAGYELVLCATRPRVKTDQGLWLSDLAPLPPVEAGDLVIVPGFPTAAIGGVEPAMYGWLRDAYAAGAEIASVCTAAFLLGRAGLLDGRLCTTHWSRVAELQRLFPRARVLADRLFVTDGRVTSSAGIASGIDMALWLVERRDGPHVAAAIAREMVVYLRRDGAHQQQSVYLDYRTHLHQGVHRVQDWLLANPSEDATLARLAALAALSPRHLTRVFRQATGISIQAYTTRLRLELARGLLHDPGATVEAVAGRCGFASARQLRRLWRAAFGTTPSQARGQGVERRH